jgi:hypothetical protein
MCLGEKRKGNRGSLHYGRDDNPVVGKCLFGPDSGGAVLEHVRAVQINEQISFGVQVVRDCMHSRVVQVHPGLTSWGILSRPFGTDRGG